MKLHPVVWLKKISLVLVATMKPLGAWGLAGLALLDSAFIPLPTSMDGTVLIYVQGSHARFPLYCLVAALASSVGALVPYYIGRAGGELFLLKRINRERYEAMRDKFERQEFMAIMIPALLPPPTPIKVFEFAAGVFEMKPLNFVSAIFAGKLIQFLVVSILFILFGPTLMDTVQGLYRDHRATLWAIIGVILLAIFIYILRKLFARRSTSKFPMEEETHTQADS